MPSFRIVVLISGTGSLLATLLRSTDQLGAAASGEMRGRLAGRAEVVAVIADRDAAGLEFATSAGIASRIVAPADFGHRSDWDVAVADAISAFAPDLVVSAGFMRLLGAPVLARHSLIINTHPALLPSFPGAHAVRDALAAGVDLTGATIHRIDPGLDTGPVIARREVAIVPNDTEATLHERIKIVERELLLDVVSDLANAAERAVGAETTGRTTCSAARPSHRSGNQP